MELHQVLSCMRSVAPEPLAEAWDAVGLHVGWHAQPVRRAMLCIDLTEPVFDEAREQGVDLIVAYHPPIFKPLASLTDVEPQGRILLQAIREGMVIYSPHTALDSAAGGVNDWLAEGLGPGRTSPIRPAASESVSASQQPLPSAAENAGQGRVLTLDEPISVQALADRLKQRLGMTQMHVSSGKKGTGVFSPRVFSQPTIERLGLCPGAGGSLLSEAEPIQAFITGEMRHHDQLAAKARGIALLLPGHSETERPYLPTYRQKLIDAGAGEIDWLLSDRDTAPTELC